MNLIRDVLDKQLLDRQRRPIGRADGIIMEIRDDQAPRLSWLETGPVTAARRVSPRLARWVAAFTQRSGPHVDGAFRIPWSAIHSTGKDVQVEIDAQETPTFAWEQWVRDRIIQRIPGA
jgi:hypothetical protein